MKTVNLTSLMLFSMFFLGTKSINALPSKDVETTYYSDQAKTNIVGGSILSCFGRRRFWGEKTNFKEVFSSSCEGNTTPKPNKPNCEFTPKGCSNTEKRIKKYKKLPFCSVASRSGASWHNWTAASTNLACDISFSKVLNTGQKVNKVWRGYYNFGLNKAKLSCNEGTKNVSGNGSQVFKNALKKMKNLNWRGCIIKVKKND